MPPWAGSYWLSLLLALAAARTVTGVAVFLCGPALFEAAVQSGYFPLAFHLLLLVAFGSVGVWLVLSSPGRSAAVTLGASLLIVATSYANWPLDAAAGLVPWAAPWLRLMQAVHADAFLPLFLWWFARDFPVGPPIRRRPFDAAIRISAVAGGAFFLLGLVEPVLRSMGQTGAKIEALSPRNGMFYAVVLLLSGAALAALGGKIRTARDPERRRVSLFIVALLLGFGPVLVAAIASLLIPAVDRFFGESRRIHLLLAPLLAATLLSVPFTTAYAVLVHRVLDVKLLARRVLQYLLARATAGLLTLIPLAALGVYLYQHRQEALVQILSGSRLVILITAVGLGVAVLRYRRTVLDWIDRRFFREQHDARRLLADLVDRIRSCSGHHEMAHLLVIGIDRALHLSNVALLLDEPDLGVLTDPLEQVRPLDTSCPLARLAARSENPLEVDLSDPRSPGRKLPEIDRHWLVDGRFRLLVPLAASDGSLLGLLALGEKKSGLPFLRDDRELLRTIATSAALGIELQRFRFVRHSRPGFGLTRHTALEPYSPRTHRARECATCGRLHLPATERCSRCGQGLSVAGVPFILPGKFRFEERIGEGGMGVVYRAVDLALGRSVAVKTLRNLSPEHALQLRREAQTAASVSHPNLAFIYGLETWRGTPLLIMEFLEGGTLAQRIHGHPFAPTEVVELGLAMARALDRLHAEEILHRDLKPSNIGFSADQIPKLMDFGIARLLLDPRPDTAAIERTLGEPRLPPTSIWLDRSRRDARSGQRKTNSPLLGTLAYMPPEVLRGASVDAAVDLWGLALVLYECLLGGHLLPEGGGNVDARNLVRQRAVPDIRLRRPDCPAPLANLLARALHRQRDPRPKTARELERWLLDVQRQIA